MALPLVAAVMIGASFIVHHLFGGVTQILIGVEADPQIAYEKLADSHLKRAYIEPFRPENMLDVAACQGIPIVISIEQPSYSLNTSRRDELMTWAKTAGFKVCAGPMYSSNQLPRNASSWSRWFLGWEALVMFSLSALVVGVIYFRRGRIDGARRLSLARKFMSGLVAAAALFAVNLIAFGDYSEEGGELYSFVGADITLPLFAALSILVPFIEEAAFRAWLIPKASRAIGKGGGVDFIVRFFFCRYPYD